MTSMKLCMPGPRAFWFLLLIGAMTAIPARLWGEETGRGEAEKPKPVTAGDPEIPTDHLKLLAKPLTKEELVVEANASRDLLKAKVQQIADKQVSVKQQKEDVEEAQEAPKSRPNWPSPLLRRGNRQPMLPPPSRLPPPMKRLSSWRINVRKWPRICRSYVKSRLCWQTA